MKILQDLLEVSILGNGMSKQARAADVDQSDREYIAQRQKRQKRPKVGDMCTHGAMTDGGEVVKIVGKTATCKDSKGRLLNFDIDTLEKNK